MRCSRGFTLVEALAVLAVTGVMAAVAVPSLAGVMRSARLSSASNELLGSLLLARSEAVKRRVRVVTCRSANGAGCADGGGWHQGWIVFADTDGDGERDPGEALIQVQPPLGGAMRLTGTVTVAKYVSYTPTGSTRLVGGGFQAGTLTLCAPSRGAAMGRQVIVNATGRPRTQRVQLASCA